MLSATPSTSRESVWPMASELTVLDDWNSGREGRILREAHSSACGTFGTVLGPNSDRFHRDHFHFDVASYRSGAYCR
jgi:hypothetical protein